jgi:Amt family ammonium transporter
MLEAGHINAKNVKGVLLKNFSDNAIGVVVWVLFGWGLYEGDSAFAAGNGSTFLTSHKSEDLARMFQQFGFACTATTLVSGAVIGRCKFAVYLVLAFFLTGVFYPIQAHWAWNPNGWLGAMGFIDFAGVGSYVCVSPDID